MGREKKHRPQLDHIHFSSLPQKQPSTMAPVISTPTAITGVKTAGGKPAQRLPIDAFRTQHEFAFALYVQALAAWQKNGNEKFDQDNANGTSYFQVSGNVTNTHIPLDIPSFS